MPLHYHLPDPKHLWFLLVAVYTCGSKSRAINILLSYRTLQCSLRSDFEPANSQHRWYVLKP